jgi:hypothetical protein
MISVSHPFLIENLLESKLLRKTLNFSLGGHLSWLFAKGPKTISELTPFSSQFPNILYVTVKLKHVNSKTVLGPFANNLLNFMPKGGQEDFTQKGGYVLPKEDLW